MTTFGGWLKDQVQRDDACGMIARIWESAADNRPRASAPSTIQRWMQQQFPDNRAQIDEAFLKVISEWRALKEGRHLRPVSEGDDPTPHGQRTLKLPPTFEDEVRLRLSAIEQNLQLIAAHMGIELVEPVSIARAIEAHWAEMDTNRWQALADTADYAAADAELEA